MATPQKAPSDWANNNTPVPLCIPITEFMDRWEGDGRVSRSEAFQFFAAVFDRWRVPGTIDIPPRVDFTTFWISEPPANRRAQGDIPLTIGEFAEVCRLIAAGREPECLVSEFGIEAESMFHFMKEERIALPSFLQTFEGIPLRLPAYCYLSKQDQAIGAGLWKNFAITVLQSRVVFKKDIGSRIGLSPYASHIAFFLANDDALSRHIASLPYNLAEQKIWQLEKYLADIRFPLTPDEVKEWGDTMLSLDNEAFSKLFGGVTTTQEASSSAPERKNSANDDTASKVPTASSPPAEENETTAERDARLQKRANELFTQGQSKKEVCAEIEKEEAGGSNISFERLKTIIRKPR